MKKINKKLIVMLICLVLVIGAMAVNAFAAEEVASGTCGKNVTWVLNDDGTLTISGEGEMANHYDPSYPWHSYRTQIKTIVIEEGVTSIGVSAFVECTALTSVTIPESVKTIETEAFFGCTALTSINFPEGVTTIYSWAFNGCTSLTSATLPASLETISIYAFDNCPNLTGIWVDEDSQNFSNDENGVLYNKDKSELVMAHSSLTGEYIIPDGVTAINASAFERCRNLTSVRIPETVTHIGQMAFCDCSGLTNLLIPDSVTRIDFAAFAGCSNLTAVIFDGDTPEFRGAIFIDVKADVYYPIYSDTWTEEVLQDYGGEITWRSYDPDEPIILVYQGDVNLDGEITNSDLIMIARYIVGLCDAESEEAEIIAGIGDMDEDGEVTNTDLIALARIIVGL